MSLTRNPWSHTEMFSTFENIIRTICIILDWQMHFDFPLKSISAFCFHIVLAIVFAPSWSTEQNKNCKHNMIVEVNLISWLIVFTLLMSSIVSCGQNGTPMFVFCHCTTIVISEPHKQPLSICVYETSLCRIINDGRNVDIEYPIYQRILFVF